MRKTLKWIAGVTATAGVAGLIYAAPALAENIGYGMGFGRGYAAQGSATPGAGAGYGMMQGWGGDISTMHQTMLPIMQQMPAIQSAVMGDVASKLGMSLDELNAAYRNGQTLATLAAAKNVSLDELKSTMTTSMKAQLDKLVAANSLTADQEQQMLDLMTNWIQGCITGNYYGMMGGGNGMMGGGRGMMGGGSGYRGGANPGKGN
ncbi:MAG: hypothetical protein ACM3XM_02060 [Mycobacterium leprae]